MIQVEDSVWDVMAKGSSSQLVSDGRLVFNQNSIHPEHGTALSFALRRARGNIVHTLLQHDPWLSYSHRGESLLHIAVRYSSRAEVAALLSAGVSPNSVTPSGETPLHYAARYDRPAAAIELMSRGADPRARNNEGRPPSHVALHQGHVQVARAILDSVPRLIEDTAGNTELHLAASLRMPQFVEFACRRFEDSERLNHDGLAALHIAAIACDEATIRRLLENGVKRSLKTREGLISADLALDASPETLRSIQTLLTAAA